MRESPLKIALMGLDEGGGFLLEAAQGLDCFTIAAVADSDANTAQQFSKLAGCASYDDYRQLIMQNQLDCLFVSAPIHTCVEYLRMAIKKKFNIFKLPPLARNYGEAAELVKLAEAEGVSLVVANPGRFAQSALALRAFIQNNPTEQFFFILAASERKNEHNALSQKWQSDPVLAGGGAILYDCWEIIDRIVWNFGIPQQVYCPVLSTVEGVAGSASPDRQQRLYLTEDAAIVTMKFSDILSGTLLAGRAAGAFDGKPQKWLAAQGQNILIKVSDKNFEATDSQGRCLQRDEFNDDNFSRIKKAMENFGSNLIAPDNNPLISTAADNLKNMAVIEAAYLSARTGVPEEPAKILKIA
ncbi:MAG: Gfo/Idh/MocA family oxidoreductase [Planctomycetota bacterium]